MANKMRFYVMHNSKTGDVEFVDASRGLRMKELLLNGFVNIGSGECKDVSELNRGICNNMRGLYEYQKRQNDMLKVKLEEALQKLKEVHRISGLGTGIQQSLSHSVTAPFTQGSLEDVRCQHKVFAGGQYRNANSLPLRERISANKQSQAEQEPHLIPVMRTFMDEVGFGHLVKEFWEDVN